MEKIIKYQPLISVIVPVYNVTEYLPRCLDSIINQTYVNLEIILIDDGSKDNSGIICDEYADKDSRIIVVHQENQGVSQSRNVGVALARGEYAMFVDSDDWVEVELCDTLLKAVMQYNVHSAMCAYFRDYPEKTLTRILHSENTIFSGKYFQRRICGPIGEELKKTDSLDSYGTVWGKLYPTDKLKKNKFVDISIIGTSEDSLYNYEVFNCIRDIVYVNIPLYHYRKELNNSITGGYKKNLDIQLNCLYDRMMDVINSNALGNEHIVALNNRIALNTIGMGLNCIQDDACLNVKYRRVSIALNSQRRKEALKCLNLKYMPIHWKLFFFFAKNRFAFLLLMLLLSIKKLKRII